MPDPGRRGTGLCGAGSRHGGCFWPEEPYHAAIRMHAPVRAPIRTHLVHTRTHTHTRVHNTCPRARPSGSWTRPTPPLSTWLSGSPWRRRTACPPPPATRPATPTTTARTRCTSPWTARRRHLGHLGHRRHETRSVTVDTVPSRGVEPGGALGREGVRGGVCTPCPVGNMGMRSRRGLDGWVIWGACGTVRRRCGSKRVQRVMVSLDRHCSAEMWGVHLMNYRWRDDLSGKEAMFTT